MVVCGGLWANTSSGTFLKPAHTLMLIINLQKPNQIFH
jgi:hypothetical protein